MKILAIGDPHGALKKIKKIPKKNIDLILLTGDLGQANIARQVELIENRDYTPKEAKEAHMEIHDSTLGILRYLSQYAPIYTIQGNVGVPTLAKVKKDKEKYGISLPSTRAAMDKMKNVTLVKNRVRVLDNVRIGFLEYFIDTCWVKEFKPSDYKKRMAKAKKQTDKASKVLKRFNDLDIFVFHQPPYGILDKVGPLAPNHWRGKHAGSKVIRTYIEKHQPPYALCGHIHEGEGHKKIGRTHVYNLGVGGHVTINI